MEFTLGRGLMIAPFFAIKQAASLDAIILVACRGAPTRVRRNAYSGLFGIGSWKVATAAVLQNRVIKQGLITVR